MNPRVDRKGINWFFLFLSLFSFSVSNFVGCQGLGSDPSPRVQLSGSLRQSQNSQMLPNTNTVFYFICGAGEGPEGLGDAESIAFWLWLVP